ncbi:hypothetical protein M0804_011427 [Polistes exclamans]|nr:hypothetical protein M0804_011427 [Polistes exclamans]
MYDGWMLLCDTYVLRACVYYPVGHTTIVNNAHTLLSFHFILFLSENCYSSLIRNLVQKVYYQCIIHSSH